MNPRIILVTLQQFGVKKTTLSTIMMTRLVLVQTESSMHAPNLRINFVFNYEKVDILLESTETVHKCSNNISIGQSTKSYWKFIALHAAGRQTGEHEMHHPFVFFVAMTRNCRNEELIYTEKWQAVRRENIANLSLFCVWKRMFLTGSIWKTNLFCGLFLPLYIFVDVPIVGLVRWWIMFA